MLPRMHVDCLSQVDACKENLNIWFRFGLLLPSLPLPLVSLPLDNVDVGRNMDEIVRVVDALQLSAKHSVATPANWPHK